MPPALQDILPGGASEAPLVLDPGLADRTPVDAELPQLVATSADDLDQPSTAESMRADGYAFYLALLQSCHSADMACAGQTVNTCCAVLYSQTVYT